MAGVGLDLIHFPTNLAAHCGASAKVSEPITNNLGLISGPGIAAIYAVGALIFLAYRLDRPAYARVQEALDLRRRDADTRAGVGGEVGAPSAR